MCCTLIHKLSTRIRQSIGKFADFRYIVDKTVISNYYTFRYIVSTLSSTLPGKRIREAYSQNPDELVVAFDELSSALIFLCRQDANAMYLSNRAARARRNSADCLKGCPGLRVTEVAIDPADRIIRFLLDDGRTLAATLYGPRSNVLLAAEDGAVLDAFKRPRATQGTTLERPRPEQPYDFDLFRNACAGAGSASLASVMRRSFPLLGRTLVAEALLRAACDGARAAADTEARVHDDLERSVRSLLEELASPVVRVYVTQEGSPEYLSLVDLRLARPLKEERMPDIHAAIGRTLALRGALERGAHEQESILTPLREEIAKSRRALARAEEDASGASRAEEYEQCGNALLGALPSLRKGARTFAAGIGGREVEIALEPSLSPLENARKYFTRAKRARAAAAETSRRREELRSRIELAGRLLAEAERTPAGEGPAEFLRAHGEELRLIGLAPAKRKEALPPFRLFTVDGGFEVWAGKNGSNNDLLTLRYAKPDDLWFHARGGSGSHVVLRKRSGKGEPPRRALEQAAAIAAYYSKMKTAGTVAVAMTERRFVRKPRGAAPGTVIIEREKVLFVAPALPKSAAL